MVQSKRKSLRVGEENCNKLKLESGRGYVMECS